MMRLSFLLLLISSIPSFSQEYVVTNKGDSLIGPVKILSYDQLDRVQVVTNKKIILTALQVKLIKIKDELYRPAKHENSVRFMKVLKPGYLSLLGFRVENQLTYDGRLLLKLDGQSIEMPNLTFKRDMIAFLQECEVVTDRIKNGDYGRRDIETIIEAYNACFREKGKAAATAATVIESSKGKLEALNNLKAKTEKSTDPKSKDALDLIGDIQNKVIKGESIPNYQVEALKSLLSGMPELKTELDQVLAVIK